MVLQILDVDGDALDKRRVFAVRFRHDRQDLEQARLPFNGIADERKVVAGEVPNLLAHQFSGFELFLQVTRTDGRCHFPLRSGLLHGLSAH